MYCLFGADDHFVFLFILTSENFFPFHISSFQGCFPQVPPKERTSPNIIISVGNNYGLFQCTQNFCMYSVRQPFPITIIP